MITGEYHLGVPVVRNFCWTIFFQDFCWTAAQLEVDNLFCSLVFFCRTTIADPANLIFHWHFDLGLNLDERKNSQNSDESLHFACL